MRSFGKENTLSWLFGKKQRKLALVAMSPCPVGIEKEKRRWIALKVRALRSIMYSLGLGLRLGLGLDASFFDVFLLSCFCMRMVFVSLQNPGLLCTCCCIFQEGLSYGQRQRSYSRLGEPYKSMVTQRVLARLFVSE